MRLFSEILGAHKGSPSTAVEHASVEVDAGVPRLEGVLPLLVDVFLVQKVVLLGDDLPVIAGEERVIVVSEVLEVVVGLIAEDHAEPHPGLGKPHVQVASIVVTRVVAVPRLAELALSGRDLQGATDKVVPLVDSLAGPGVEEASAELSGSVRWQTGRLETLTD